MTTPLSSRLRHHAGFLPALWVASVLLVGTLWADAWAAGTIRGRVTNARSGEPVAFANVRLQGTAIGALTDGQGRFQLAAVPDALYNIDVSMLGFRRVVLYEIEISGARPVSLEIALEEEALRADSITVTASPFPSTPESPNSVRSLNASEIERLPGADRDLSRVVQTQPGVASTPTFRNDVLVRGGAPNENRFYLEGLEIPVINHFATQGSTGGPVGMIDVNTLEQVDLLTGAFPANRGNALSSVMELQLKEGNDLRLVRRATVGASDGGLSLDGPLGDRARLTLSARRSYLQFIFSALGLPFLPEYNDAQFRVRSRLSNQDEISVLGIGAIDRFKLNLDANDTELKRYLLDQLPVTPQWNFTTGATWKHFGPTGARTLVVSHSRLDNRATKYLLNDDRDPANLLLDYRSQENQTSARLEWLRGSGPWRFSWGAGADLIEYENHTYQKRATPGGLIVVDFDSRLTFPRYAAHAQTSRQFASERGELSIGVRADGASWASQTANPLEQLSPRAAVSWRLAPELRASASVARYHQLPPTTVLGYRDSLGALVNRDHQVRWIRADHIVGGLERALPNNARVSLEGFLKRYTRYPFLIEDGVSLANLGADFGVIGNAPANSQSRGRSYGLEFLAQQRLYAGWYGIGSYTWLRSEFSDAEDRLVPSSWDNRHVVSLTAGRRYGRGWEIGARWRFLGGAPCTPDDLEITSRREVWDATGRGQPDWARLNTNRNGAFHQLDLRVDKRWAFAGSAFEAYVDVQNVYAFAARLAPITSVVRDAAGDAAVDPNDATRYLLKTLPTDPGTPFPTIGLRLTF